MNLNNLLKRTGKAIVDYLRPDAPDVVPPALTAAIALTANNAFAGVLAYRSFDSNYPFLHLDEGTVPAVGFILKLDVTTIENYPALLEAIKSLSVILPEGSTLQIGTLVSKPESYINPVPSSADYSTYYRHKTISEAVSSHTSLSAESSIMVRNVETYLSIRIPFLGDVKQHAEIAEFYGEVSSYMHSVADTFSIHKIESSPLDALAMRVLFRRLLNPQHSLSEIESRSKSFVNFNSELVMADTSYECDMDGGLTISTNKAQTCFVKTLTVDAFSSNIDIKSRSSLHLGALSAHAPIYSDYWVYTTMIFLEDDALSNYIKQYLGSEKNSNLDITDSVWHNHALTHLLGDATIDNENLVVVKAYTGITLFSDDSSKLKADESVVLEAYTHAGYRIAEETYISLFAHLSAMPLQLTLKYEHPQTGYRRANLMNMSKALNILHLPPIWHGNESSKLTSLLPVVCKQGQLSTVNFNDDSVLQSAIVMSSSVYDKNIMMKELLHGSYLSRSSNRSFMSLEVGSELSYLGEALGIQIEYIERGQSLNPFYGIESPDVFGRLQDQLTEFVRDLAYPQSNFNELDGRLDQLIKDALYKSWERQGEKWELRNVVEQFKYMSRHAQEDEIANLYKDLVSQLQPLLDNEVYSWFKGKPTLDTSGFHMLSLNALRNSPLDISIVYLLTSQLAIKNALVSESYLTIMLHGMSNIVRAIKNQGVYGAQHNTKMNWIISLDAMSDLIQNEFLKTLFSLSPTLYIGTQDKQGLYMLMDQQLLGLTEEDLTVVLSLANTKYTTNVFVKKGNYSNVFLFAYDEYTRLMYSIAPTDLSNIDQLVSKGISRAEAIKICLEGNN